MKRVKELDHRESILSADREGLVGKSRFGEMVLTS